MRGLILLVLLLAGNAAAQYSPEAREVLAIAPALETFAGSKSNFESLAAGPRGGRQVTLATITPDGMREIVSFTAAKPLPADETARVLQNARYHLFGRGLAAPSGWDIGLVLMGRPFAGSAANYRSLMRGLTEGKLVTLVDPVHMLSRERFIPQCALPEAEAHQVLMDAAEWLAAQHIGDPMIDELRAAVVRVLEGKCRAAAA